MHWNRENRILADQNKGRKLSGLGFVRFSKRGKPEKMPKQVQRASVFVFSSSGRLMEIPEGQKLPADWKVLSASQATALARAAGFRRNLGSNNAALIIHINKTLKAQGIRKVLKETS